MLRSSVPGLLLLGLLLSSAPLAAQLGETDWAPRPDARAPAGVFGDRLSPAGGVDARVVLQHHSFRDLVAGQDEISPILVLNDWDYTPMSASRQAAVFEVAGGVTSWLSLMTRVPVVRSEIELGDMETVGTTSTTGLGDVEIHSLLGLHDRWPVRAHLMAGVAVPSGTHDQRGTVLSTSESVLPYALQPGAGTWTLLPGAVIATENRYGTVGFQVAGRYHLGENDRNWHPGDVFNANLYMQYRFNDWIGGSMRVDYVRQAPVSGVDEGLNPFFSPLHSALATGGTRVQVPFGINILFAEGTLRGNHLQAELLMPVHSDLNGPQLSQSWGAVFAWGFGFGGDRGPPPPAAPVREPIDRGPIQRATNDEPPRRPSPVAEGTPTELCLADGRAMTVFVTAQGEMLIGDDRLTVEEAGGAEAVFGEGYAQQESWFVDDEAIRFEDRDYHRAGGEITADCPSLRRVGEFRGVPLFVHRDSEAPHDTLHVPVRPGVWQLYRVDLARVRG